VSVCGDNPEWFDEWLVTKAYEGRLGEDARVAAEMGEFVPDWGTHDPDGTLLREAIADYYERRT